MFLGCSEKYEVAKQLLHPKASRTFVLDSAQNLNGDFDRRSLIFSDIKVIKEKMNKKGKINSEDILELVKIGIIVIIGFIIIKALLSSA